MSTAEDRTPRPAANSTRHARARVLYVSHVAELGGGERSLLDLIESLDRVRFVAHVAVPGPGPLPSAVERAGAVVLACPPLGRIRRRARLQEIARSVRRMIAGHRALAEIVRAKRIDLVHANSLTSALFATAGRVPLACPVISHVRDVGGGAIARAWLGRRVQRIVVPSQSCATGMSRERTRIVANGIHLQAATTRRGISGTFQILTVAHFAPWKGHDRLIEAAALVCEQRSDVRFLIAGTDLFGDHEGWVRSLRRRLNALGLSEQVEFLGHRDDVSELLASVDLLVHPAFPEPFGRVIVEALAQECPVLALAGSHGPAEILRDGIGGRLVRPHSAQALAAAILELASRPRELESLARGARAKAVAQFGRETMSRRIEQIYDELLARAVAEVKRS